MKKLFVAMCSVLLMLGVGTSRSFASAPGASTQDIQVNVNGTYYDLINDIPGGSANPGYGTGSFINDVNSLGVQTSGGAISGFNTVNGLGTITVDVTVTAPGQFMDILLDEEVGNPAYNEFVTPSGSAPTSLGGAATWEADNLENTNLNIYNNASGLSSDGLTDKNYIPVGANSNFSGYYNYGYTGPGSEETSTTGGCPNVCNGDAAIALGYTFSTTGDYVLTVTASTAPGAGNTGFYLDQTNPQDGSNGGGQSDVYFSENVAPACTSNCVAPPPVIPEPSPWILLATGLVGLGMIQVRRKYSAQGVL